MKTAIQPHGLISYNTLRSSVEVRPNGVENLSPDEAFRHIVKLLFQRDFDNIAADRILMRKAVIQGPHELEVTVVRRRAHPGSESSLWLALVDGVAPTGMQKGKADTHRQVLEQSLGGIFEFNWESLQSHLYWKPS